MKWEKMRLNVALRRMLQHARIQTGRLLNNKILICCVVVFYSMNVCAHCYAQFWHTQTQIITKTKSNEYELPLSDADGRSLC